MKNKKLNKQKMVYIQATNEYFMSIMEAEEALGLSHGSFRPNRMPIWLKSLNPLVTEKPKVCRICGKFLEKENIGLQNSRIYLCDTCKKEQNKIRGKKHNFIDYRKYKYGLDQNAFQYLLEQQNGVCAICGNPESSITKYGINSLSVDHDHSTGTVRGLLCSNCNHGLGCFHDNLDLLDKAKTYLMKQYGA